MGKARSRLIGYNPRVLALIKTFGCKVNYADGEDIAHSLAARGWDCRHASDESDYDDVQPDLIIVNSCAVTSTAVAKVRRYIRRSQREYPSAKIAVTGCCAHNEEIAAELRSLGAEVMPDCRSIESISELTATRPAIGRSRRFIKVQDGCDSFCSYCIVPYLRERWNAPLGEVLGKVKSVAIEGVSEIVICGVNLGLYTEPQVGFGFTELVRKIIEGLPEGGMRLRLSSIEPEHVDGGLIDLLGDARLCPHLHIPLQSGSSRVLGEMGRRCSLERYIEIACEIRERYPFCSITTDLIVGYPTETDADFLETCEMVKIIGFERSHVFRYSRRPRTKAALLKPLPNWLVTEREKSLISLCAEVADARWKRFIGRTSSVALEDGMIGYGEAYQRVKLTGERHMPRSLAEVRLTNYEAGLFTGE
jgi:threonylcarbamoyladenosine tRNA methylthiotransferase MtaB